jgi:hypothetical protein
MFVLETRGHVLRVFVEPANRVAIGGRMHVAAEIRGGCPAAPPQDPTRRQKAAIGEARQTPDGFDAALARTFDSPTAELDQACGEVQGRPRSKAGSVIRTP